MGDDPSEIIDVIAVDPTTGIVELAVLDDRDWSDLDGHIRWLVAKLNLYLSYALDGEMAREPKYAERPARFAVHLRFAAPQPARQVLLRIREHLRDQSIDFIVTESWDIKRSVVFAEWSASTRGDRQ